jgi:nucleoside phosphorylase
MFSVEKMIAIVAAMPEELAPLVARAEDARVLSALEHAPFELLAARVAGRTVALAVTGDGERNARRGAEALASTLPPEGLIVVGVSGAATSELAPGALVVATEVRGDDGAVWRAEPAAVELAVRRAGARAACVVSSRDIIDSPAAKRDVAARTAADAPVAIDLESATYVAAAARAGVPWTVLRVISDAADEALPPLLNRARDAGGAVRRGAVALRLLGNPRALPQLLRLRARVRDAAEHLADAVERVLLAS